MAAYEGFIPRTIDNLKDCSDGPTFGQPSLRFDYIQKHTTGGNNPLTGLPDGYTVCEGWLHYHFQVDRIQLNQQITGAGLINITGPITSGSAIAALGEVTSNGGTHVLSAKKNFDIPHPTKSGWRLRHTCIEGPENGVYFRGTLKDSNVIELPDYWTGLVDIDSITVQLTQIGTSQDLIVEKIEWGKRIIIKSGVAANIHCHYLVNGTRKDGENLIVEYEGESAADYPGDNSQYSVSGFHYDVKGDKE